VLLDIGAKYSKISSLLGRLTTPRLEDLVSIDKMANGLPDPVKNQIVGAIGVLRSRFDVLIR